VRNAVQGVCIVHPTNNRVAGRYGFPEENLRILIDSQNDGSLPLPTAQNIMVRRDVLVN
jgi:hypothetical protein